MLDVLIIGGGINGLMTAYHCVEAGLNVEIVDQGQIGQQCSWAGGGILSPLNHWKYSQSIKTMAQFGHEFYPKFSRLLESYGGFDYTKSGLVAFVDQPLGSADLPGTGMYKADEVNQQTTGHFQPSSSLDNYHRYHFPEIAQLRPPKLVSALEQKLQKDVSMHPFTRVLSITSNDDFACAETQHRKIKAKKVVVTAGAWTSQFFSGCKEVASVKPIKGQIIAYRLSQPLFDKVILINDRYFIPRPDNVLLVGSSVENVGFNNNPTKEVRASLEAFAVELIPSLSNLKPFAHWAGLRPATESGQPIVGCHPTMPNILINTGQFRNGIILAPASAQRIVDIISGASQAGMVA